MFFSGLLCFLFFIIMLSVIRRQSKITYKVSDVLANRDFRLRCDSGRSFRRAMRGEFLDAAVCLSMTRCLSRTFSRFGSEAGRFSQG